MVEYNTYRTPNGYITVDRIKQRTENGGFKDVIYSSLGRPAITTYDEYSYERLIYLANILFRRQK